jgi:hypothetical protein
VIVRSIFEELCFRRYSEPLRTSSEWLSTKSGEVQRDEDQHPVPRTIRPSNAMLNRRTTGCVPGTGKLITKAIVP